MHTLILGFLFIVNILSLGSDSTLVKSEIEKVTVFKNQAQIQRTANVSLKSGKTIVVFTGLSETLNDKSIQLKGMGNFTLLSLTTRNDFSEKTTWKSEIQSLQEKKKRSESKITLKKADLKVIESEIEMLNSTQNIITKNKLSSSEIEQLLNLYRTKLSELLKKQISATDELVALQEELEILNKQIAESGITEKNSFKEVIAEIQSDAPQTIEFTLDYLVYSAGWEAAYDLRSDGINSPLIITYKAKIYQNTGIDWKDISFTINSGDPSSNSTKPELNTSYVSYYFQQRNNRTYNPSNVIVRRNNESGIVRGRITDKQSGEALSGVNVMVAGTAQGTSTNRDGAFQLPWLQNGSYQISISYIGFRSKHIPLTISNNGFYLEIPMNKELVMEEEIVVTNETPSFKKNKNGMFDYEQVPVRQEALIIQNEEISNQTSFSYEIGIPYSVPSDGKDHTVEIKRESPKTEYSYSTAPKLSAFAYLIGSLPEWNALNLIQGEANIYFENRFVGSTFLNPVSFDDTLSISLGKDERIVIEREQLNEYASKNFFRSKTREYHAFEIRIRNTKSEPITIAVEDQIPLSTNEDIKVTAKELSNGNLDEQTGIITWNLAIAPGETKKLRLDFELEYPKGRKIVY